MGTETKHETRVGKPRGPVATPGRVRVTVYLDKPLVQWGKEQEGGLSDLMRRLLIEEQVRQGNMLTELYPEGLRVAYQQLIGRKLRVGLTADEEQELAQIRARINAADRTNSVWRLREQAAIAIDQELNDLARIIEGLPERTDKEDRMP